MPQVIGSHQLSPEAKEKAAGRRAKQAAVERKSNAGEREQAQQLKRQEKKQEELVRFAAIIKLSIVLVLSPLLLPNSLTRSNNITFLCPIVVAVQYAVIAVQPSVVSNLKCLQLHLRPSPIEILSMEQGHK